MPSDATDMVVVHRVFRREFQNMPGLISAVPARDTARARIVGNHVKFMVAALHHHHAAEDDVVWPRLRSRASGHEVDVRRMLDEHAEIASAVDRVDRHLDDEERNAVPLIEEHLTQQEWAAAVKQAASFISPRNLRLGIVLGGLVLDAASDDERRIILSGAPLPQRLVVQLFGARTLAAYRRRLQGMSS